MIDDDGYDGIRSHGVDPDWNPFSMDWLQCIRQSDEGRMT